MELRGSGRIVGVATGQYRQPIVPSWPGRECYAGRLVHSAAYVTAAPYAGQRVLVVGAGNSGAEIATDLADHGAAYVALSVRSAPPIVPRDPFGMPVQHTSLLLSALPPAIADRLGWATARLVLGDLARYGMPKGRFAPYTTQRVPLIDVGFVDALKQRRLQLRPALEALTETAVRFADGTSEPFDAVIAATGFTPGLASRSSTRATTCWTRPANRAAGRVSRRRARDSISSASHTACADICSRRTARRADSRGTPPDICR